MSRHKKLVRRRLLLGFYILCTFGTYALAWWLRTLLPLWNPEAFQPLLPATGVSLYFISIIWSFCFVLFGVHHAERTSELAVKLVKAVGLSSMLLFAVLFLGNFQNVSRSFIVMFLTLNVPILMIGHRLWVWVSRRTSHKNPHRLLVVGTDERAQSLVRVLEHNDGGLKIIGYLAATGKKVDTESIKGIPVRGSLLDLPRLLTEDIVDEVLFIVPPERLPAHEIAFAHCEEHGISYRIAFEPLPKTRCEVQVDELNGVPLLTFSRVPMDAARLLLKRCLDIAIAAFVLLVLSPLLLLVALAIKLTSKGSVIYAQERLGRNGRRFDIYKFRTMVVDADQMKDELLEQNEVEAPFFKMKRDPRVTFVGRWLRRWSLDELPQLINVIGGQMSLVGPRPILPTEFDFFRPWQRRRLSIKPGITGLCQLRGRSARDFQERIDWDLKYIDNWSLSLDLKILVRTIPYVVFGEGAH